MGAIDGIKSSAANPFPFDPCIPEFLAFPIASIPMPAELP
jgi:hypothetical protein